MQRLVFIISLLFGMNGFVLAQNQLNVYGTVYERDSLRDAKILLYACQVEFEPYTIGGKTSYIETAGLAESNSGPSMVEKHTVVCSRHIGLPLLRSNHCCSADRCLFCLQLLRLSGLFDQ